MVEWIKCSDRMPPNDSPVLCYGAAGLALDYEVLWFTEGDDYPWQDDDDAFYGLDAVTHWMPLPRAPDAATPTPRCDDYPDCVTCGPDTCDPDVTYATP